MTDIIKYGLIAAGILIMALSFWYHSARKITVNQAVMWEILGIILISIEIIPIFSGWAYQISSGIELVLLFMGIICLWGSFQASVQVSELALKNQELAIQVSLLIQENEKIMRQLEEISDRVEENEEKTSVRD